MEKLLDLYGAPEAERDQLIDTARDARSRRRCRSPESSIPLGDQRFFDLTRPAGPSCWCILGEASLRADVGGPAVMAAQLQTLNDLSRTLSGLVIQVLPLGSGAHGSMGMARTLLSFDPPAEPVCTSTPTSATCSTMDRPKLPTPRTSSTY